MSTSQKHNSRVRVGKMESCVSRNLRILLHGHIYFCVIKIHFLVKLCVRNIMLRALHALSHLILGTTYLHGKNHPHFKDKENEVYRGLKKNLLKPNIIAESRCKCTSASKDCYPRPLPQALQCLDKSLEKPTAQKCTLDNYVLSTEVEQQIFSVTITVQC